MTINILNEYINLTVKQINEYMKLTFTNKFKKKYVEAFTREYINIRYYNYYDEDNKNTIRKKILLHLRKIAEDLTLDNLEDKDLIEQICVFFYYVLYFDNVVYYKSLEEKIGKIAKIRKKLLNKEDIDFEENLYKCIKTYQTKKEKIINNFEDEEFFLKISNYKDRLHVFRVNLKFNIKMPKVYSEYAIRKAFNNGIVNEDRLIIEYYLITIESLKDILKQNFKRQYLVEFTPTILEKPQKLKSLLNILNNPAIQEKVCLKVRYEDIKKNQNIIYNLMQEGFRIAIIIDNTFKSNYKNIESLKMFKYILLNKDLACFNDIKKSRDKQIVKKIVEI